ncbi:DEAD box ATP-dependent RNA helicase, putative [Pediculus humanus corporis]|uniref:RNA helicase n=1 Tax=Pediculus humanus subsp. corporis TaxID=121224 RepID=E0VBH6_PEDHC|nr:DEAD box ATP-dependent RNA helicase, putative [Pediculus humanus corporis]EEB10732.1 DEAD box ATP-dependent RNA helicase, putative [Pediculus humanus corporis]
MKERFEDLNLNKWIVRQCDSFGLTKPTPIQAHCIPKILEGNDCIGCAKTGSGKTLAFALPILQKLSEEPFGIFALVLTPTRELAFQIGEQFLAYGKVINLKLCVISGGMDMVTQGQELSKRPHIVVSTPGRLADHLDSCNTFSLKKIRFLVLDEADRLLSGQFDDQISTIFKSLPLKKQILLFSATINDTLKQAEELLSKNVFSFIDKSDVATVDNLQQFYVLCPDHVKDAYLVEVIQLYRKNNENGNIIIFTDTCRNCQLLSMTLNEVGFENVAIHSMMKQKERLAALSRFKSNIVKTLIATDIASRGLDIPTVELVINHSIPNVPKDYIHRVGRTARAGRAGMSVSLVTPVDIKLIHAIESIINTKLKEYSINDKEVIKILTQVKVTKREAEIKLDETDFYEKKMINKRKKLMMEAAESD